MVISTLPNCQTDFNPGGHIVCQGNPHDVIIGKTLDTGDYDLKISKIGR